MNTEEDDSLGPMPTLDLSDLFEPPSPRPRRYEEQETKEVPREARWPEPKSEIADQKAALSLMEGFQPDKWIKDQFVKLPGKITSCTLRWLLQSFIDDKWKQLFVAYQQLAMGATNITVEYSTDSMCLTIQGCEFFNYEPHRSRFMVLPAVKFSEVATIVSEENFITALRALAYVKELRMDFASRCNSSKCIIGNYPLHHLYFAATMHCAVHVAYIALVGLYAKSALEPGRALGIIVPPPVRDRPAASANDSKMR